jgi:transposase-like protein
VRALACSLRMSVRTLDEMMVARGIEVDYPISERLGSRSPASSWDSVPSPEHGVRKSWRVGGTYIKTKGE